MIQEKVLAVILGGGKGTRLYPLTKHRCKPAISFGGKYRLIDIPISNCINSRINRIYVLTQFLTASLHRHIFETYRMDILTRGFVEVLPAEQTLTSDHWYQGTADAVRRTIRYFRDMPVEDILILSGDQLCAMDFVPVWEEHRKKNADLTIVGHPVPPEESHRMGIIKAQADRKVIELVEKPRDLMLVKGFEDENGNYVASTGNYLFKKEFLTRVLMENDQEDFGKEIIPCAIKSGHVFLYPFKGYWEDIGTISSFFAANIDFASANPRFDLYDENQRIYTHPRFLPAAKIQNSHVKESLISEGSMIDQATIHKSVVGIRSVIHRDVHINESILLGNDFYQGVLDGKEIVPRVGSRVKIEQAIIDKNCIIEEGVVIRGRKNSGESFDDKLFCVRDGIVVISKGTHISAGTRIEV